MTRSSAQNALVRTVLAGVATGGRTFTPIAALALSAPTGGSGQPDATLAKPRAQAALGLLAIGELIGDKLPNTPSRLEVPGFAGRVVAGAACGVVIAARGSDGRARTIGCALTGAAAAAFGTRAGASWRSAAAARVGNDRVGAGLEDAAVLGLAALAG